MPSDRDAARKPPAPRRITPSVTASEPRRAHDRRNWVGRAVLYGAWAYLIIVLALWIWIAAMGDAAWIPTLLLFGPLWVAMMPLIPLLPAALLFRRKALWIVAAAAYVSLFRLAGFCLPWRVPLESHASIQHLRVLTCNGHRDWLDIDALDHLTRQCKPDIVLLQEWSMTQPNPAFVDDEGWHTYKFGELFLASRYPIAEAKSFSDPHWEDWGGSIMRYEIDAPGGRVPIFNLHLASPHLPFAAVLDGRPQSIDWLESHLAVRARQASRLQKLAAAAGEGAILAGDFNTPCEGRIYRRYFCNLDDAFSVAGFGLGRSYVGEGAEVRIDHVYYGGAWRCRACWLGDQIGSPHRPLIADLDRVAP